MSLFLMLQGVLALLVLNVVIGRYAARHQTANRQALASDEVTLRQLDMKMIDAQRREHAADSRINALRDQIADAERHLAEAEKELDNARRAPNEIYYVFDRLEPKPGIIWEAVVERAPDVPVSSRLEAVWRQPRRYLITAKTPKEAQDRASHRFYEKAGLRVRHVVPCEMFLPKRPDGVVELPPTDERSPRATRIPTRASAV